MRDLEADALRRLNKTEFDGFCRRLLDVEYEARFDAKAVELDGPAEDDVADGGRDLWALVKQKAVKQAYWTLLPDEPSEVWYSCKTRKDDGKRKDPGGWRKQVRDNLDPSPRIINDKTGELVEKADEHAQKKKPPPEGLLRALDGGGRFIVLVNVGAERVLEFEQGLRTLFEFWIPRVIGGTPRPLEPDQVRVRDANHLVRVFNERKFMLPPERLETLAIDEPLFLSDWDGWTTSYTTDRRDMDWQPDARREQLQAALHAFLTDRVPVFRIWGPPGVGKTRLVHHVLNDARVCDRVRFSEDIRGVQGWLVDSNMSFSNELILVIDEVAPPDAAPLTRDFRAHAPPGAKLIIVGPQDLSHQGNPPPERLGRLDDAQTRAILAKEMGEGDERVHHVLGLCRGYPLFAYWLGDALANDQELLRKPGASLTNDEDPWDATCAVLVGPRRDDEGAWRERATGRAKALLLASLTSEQAWSRLPNTDKSALADTLGSSWGALEEAARACINRSLLRLRGDLRYVSPANLERLVLNHFFSDRGPGGPPLDPKRLARRLPDFFPGLSKRAQIVGASDSCKHNLTQGALSEVRSALRSVDLDRLGQLAIMLESACHVDPEGAVGVVTDVIEDLGIKQVESAQLVSSLRSVLRHASHRELSAASFEQVESALFELTRPRTGPLRFHQADPVWARVFRPMLHLTRQPFERRFELMRKHLQSSEEGERVLAVDALFSAVDGRASVGWDDGWDNIDGPWEHELQPTPHYAVRYALIWSALLDASVDLVDTVHDRAREALARNLRRALGFGLMPAHFDRLAELSGTWTPEQRDRLAEQVDDAFHYDLTSGESDPMTEALSRLRQALAPADLLAELIAQVGRWHPGPWPIDADGRDQLERGRDLDLAKELILEPAALAGVFEWLISPRAVRTQPFALALGRADPSQGLFASLSDLSRDFAGHRFTAGYLVGWAEAIGPEVFDAWLDAAIGHEPPVLLARVLTWIPSDEHRAALLLSLMQDPQLPGDALTGFGFARDWARELSLATIDQLLIKLSSGFDGTSPGEGIGLLETRLQRDADNLPAQAREAAHTLLERQVHSPRAVVMRAWVGSVVALARRGDLRSLLVAMEEALQYPQHPHHVARVLRELIRAGLGDAVWDALCEAKLLDELERLLGDRAAPEVQSWARARLDERGAAVRSRATA